MENVINAIFNGVPQVTDHKGPPKSIPARHPQPSQSSLYIPYIPCPPDGSQVAQKFKKIAHRRIKEASCTTALHCFKISQASKVREEFPIGMVGRFPKMRMRQRS